MDGIWPDGVTWAQMFEASVSANVPAIILEDQVLSATDLAHLASGAIEWLDRSGASPGLPVVGLLQTSPEALAMAVAGATSDRPLAPLNPRLTVHELTKIVGSLAPSMIVAEESASETAYAVSATTGRPAAVIPNLAGSSRPLKFSCSSASVAFVLHTSGTTGMPKAVRITQHKLAMRVIRQGAMMQLGPGDRYASFSPFAHIAGLGTLLIALGLGAAAIPVPGFSLEAWQGLRSYRPSHAQLVPTMIETLVAQNALHLQSLRVLLYGASPIRLPTLRAAMDALPGADFVNGYGQTEGGPISCLDGHDHRRAAAERPELLLTVGRAVEGVELRIESPEANGVGEICAKAAHLFRVDADGWLRTGDLGVISKEGYLRIVSRKGDVIIRGGENVYPVEVENALSEHPGVLEAAVVGLPDSRLGQRLKAFVVPIDAAARPTSEELVSFIRERLAGYKMPADWEFVDGLPRNAIGKLQRQDLLRASADKTAPRTPVE